jgi:hypothetical protein
MLQKNNTAVPVVHGKDILCHSAKLHDNVVISLLYL